MHKLSQALQAFYQARTWTLDDIYINMIDVACFESRNISPIGPFIDGIDISTIGRVFRKNNVLGIGANYRFISYLWIATIGAIRVKNINDIGVLCQFITK